MAGDLARVSYDPSRQWRGLVAQQGRVTVEADWNEAAAIDAERVRQLTLDAVGTLGTPDGGYVVTAIPATGSPPAGAPPAGSPPTSGPGDLIIGPGTLYVGGERLELDTPVAYSAQPDWLDHSTDPRWSAPAVPAGTGYELVYLVAAEQEVAAVEDPALADVALGGPDTMGRRRIRQRFVRWPSPSAVGYQAWDAFVASLGGEGLTFDPATMTLGSATGLQVSFTSTGPAGPCQPAATGGYLGAENQMIRVMVTGVSASGAVTFVWGFDDASFLYRVQAAAYDAGSDTTTVTLASAPPDSYHFPATGQAVELLRDAVQLTAADYIASPAGFVAPLSAGFAPASMSLALTGEPPADYLSTTPQLYLRVWQATAAAMPGQAAPLGDTGVVVTLTSSTGTFHPGDFWRFAVRPVQPTIAYPDRYLATPQPPEGPRTLACPIAVLTWDDGAVTATGTVPVFASLTRQAGGGDGCCAVTVSPADVDGGATLQALLDRYATQGPVTVCLLPGTYTLPAPLLLGAQSNGLTLQACQGGAVFQAPSSPGAAFAAGLITLQGVSSVTLRGIEFSLPLAAYPVSVSAFQSLPAGVPQELAGAFSTGLQVAIGISVYGSAGLSIEDCAFNLGALGQANVFSAGISASGTMTGTTIEGCTFQCTSQPAAVPFNELTVTSTWPSALPPYQLMFGYLQTGDAATAPGATQPPAQLLDGASFENNQFLGITVPALVLAQLGALRVGRNTVRACYGGFWLVSLTGPGQQVAFLDAVDQDYSQLAGTGIAPLADIVFALATGFGWVLPAPSGTAPAGTGTAPVLQLDASGNQIETTPAGPYSGAGLIVIDFTAGAGTALVHGNRIVSRLPLGAAALVGTGAASVTGNLVLNEVPAQVTAQGVLNSYSLVVNPASSAVGSVVQKVVPASSEPVWLNPAGPAFGDVTGLIAVTVTGNVFVSPTLLPAHPGSTPGSTLTQMLGTPLNDWNTFNTVIAYGIGAPPVVTSVAPATAPAGATVLIQGSGFTGATAVHFGVTPVTPILASPPSTTELTATVPPGSGTVDVTVTTPVGTSPAVPDDEFTFLAVTGISPPTGQPPLTVTLTGSGFVAGQTAVSFGGAAATGVSVASGTLLTALLPSGTGVADVTVTVAGVASPAIVTEPFTYLTVTDFPSGSQVTTLNQSVTVAGFGFIPGQTTVILTPFVGTTGLTYTISSQNVSVNSTGTAATFAAPFAPGATTGLWQVTVRTPYGTAVQAPGFGGLTIDFLGFA
jgi:Family of unknown function (DUF6519)/IPT/TIG domain